MCIPKCCKKGTVTSCKHLLFALMFILTQKVRVLNEQHIGANKVKAMLQHNNTGKNVAAIKIFGSYIFYSVKNNNDVPPPLLICLSSHESYFYTSSDAPGLLIKFTWAHINHAATTF